jgi:hypothetical protein
MDGIPTMVMIIVISYEKNERKLETKIIFSGNQYNMMQVFNNLPISIVIIMFKCIIKNPNFSKNPT